MPSSTPIPFADRLLRILKYLVHSNLWIAFGAPALLGVTCLEWGEAFPFELGFASFCFVLLSYNLQRWVRLFRPRGWERDRPSSFLSRSNYTWLLLLSGTAGFASLFFLSMELLFVLAPLAVLSILYAMPIFPSGKGLRDLPYLKVFLISVSWAYLSVLVIAVELEVAMGIEQWLLFLERTLFIFAITVPFDIRDLSYDDPEERTFPQVLGVKGAKKLALGALAVFLGLTVVRLVLFGASTGLISGYVISTMLVGGLIQNSYEEAHSLYFEGLLDGTMLMMALILWGFETLL